MKGCSVFIVLLLVGCLPYTQDIEPSYENRKKFSELSCPEMLNTLNETTRSLESLGEQQDQNAWNDTLYIVLGLAWRPFFTVNHEKKISRLKGDKEILEQLIQQRCST